VGIVRPYLDDKLAFLRIVGHIWTMNTAISDILTQTGNQIRARRLAMGLTQADAAARAGVAYRTWRRMEKDCSASIEDLVRAAIALRCEQGIGVLFPEPAANSMDELLARQRIAADGGLRRKAGRARA
jgi:transcriptional regulator with XRE-family HTH domain